MMSNMPKTMIMMKQKCSKEGNTDEKTKDEGTNRKTVNHT